MLCRALLALASAVLAGASACSNARPVSSSASGSAAPDGRRLYAASCAACHGADLKGTPTGPPFLDAIYRSDHHADEAFLVAARSGVRPHHWNFGPMPPVSGLTDQQVAAIVAYVRSQQQAAGIR